MFESGVLIEVDSRSQTTKSFVFEEEKKEGKREKEISSKMPKDSF